MRPRMFVHLVNRGIHARGPASQRRSNQASPRKRRPVRDNGGEEELEDNPRWFHGSTAEPFAAGLGPISELMSTKPKASQAS
ncbi:hypothetical protein Q5P01_023813 [Channa striata]|uniref:Uncharacterized protein n=1 Tax=Channa striata TaxID=64152 RepID=A0AA88IV16_CHASR|nr:hypothetical protein Q5P01_023813 [Channa striata]